MKVSSESKCVCVFETFLCLTSKIHMCNIQSSSVPRPVGLSGRGGGEGGHEG